jgi:alkanesulfonate monooxygenase SsuD/methylene tetrahydromethanopterin reductase-like flavin-dependent oxidoreductase (luciferase family)
MQVEFGIWDHFENRGSDAVAQFADKIALIQAAERLGFAQYQVAEHHLSPLTLAPSPSVFLAAVAQATSRIRIGAGVYCLPLYHPVRLVQELCMLDNISGGRLEFGVGRGIRAAEHDWFGVPQDEVKPRFDEVLAIVTGAMTTGRLSHEGRYYRIDDVALDLLPVQRPYPAIWYAGDAETAGNTGFHFLTRNVAHAQRYWQLWQESSGRPGRYNAHLPAPRVAMTRPVVVRRSEAEALAIARRAWAAFESHWFATPVLLNSDGRAVSFNGPGSAARDFDTMMREEDNLVIGTPEQVGERFAGWTRQLAGLPNLMISPAVQWGDISHAEARETLALVAAEVMPAVVSVSAG